LYKQTEADLEAIMKKDWEKLKKHIKENYPQISIESDAVVNQNSPQLDWSWCKRPYFSK